MPRQRKTDKPTALEIIDPVSAPFDHIYTGHDPADERLVTTLMLAGEALAETLHPGETQPVSIPHAIPIANDRPSICEDFQGLLDIFRQIEAWIAADPRHEELLAELCGACGDGMILRVLLHNVLPPQRVYRQMDSVGKPVLSEREVAVLREVAGDRAYKEIAERLGIRVRTVNRHLENIHKKLGVHKPMQAVARAISMGYLDLDMFAFIQEAGHCSPRNFQLFDSFVSHVGMGDSPDFAGMQRLARFALLLLVWSGATVNKFSEEISINIGPEFRGGVCEVDAQSKVIRRFGSEQMLTAYDIAIAPAHAARHGFTPGHLFVIHSFVPQQGLNLAAITEFMPEDQWVRTFCGGSEIGTRLSVLPRLAFMADGRLLASSGMLTDAILIFEEGGRAVRRFAEGCYAQICVSAAGEVYATQRSGIGCIVKVFNAGGQLLRTIGGTSAGVFYSGIAVNSRNHVFVGRVENGRAFLEHFDANGDWLRSFAVPGFCQDNDTTGRLACDKQDRLYASCTDTGDVKVFAPDGASLGQIDLRDTLHPHAVAIGKEGRLWVCGRIP
jgi:DNA-binding CsgD family transcriptional regulator